MMSFRAHRITKWCAAEPEPRRDFGARRYFYSDEVPHLRCITSCCTERGTTEIDGQTSILKSKGADANGARPVIARHRQGEAGGSARYLPVQTVPARFTTGTPTELPYSVHEPS